MNEMILERLELLAERAARLAVMGRVLKSELDDLVEEVVGEIEAEEAEDAEAMEEMDSEESMDLSEEDLDEIEEEVASSPRKRQS